MITDEPPLRSFLEEGRAVARVVNTAVDHHRRTCPCMIDRERLAYTLGATPECEALPGPISLERRRRPPHLALEDVEQLQGIASILLRRASIGRPPVRESIVGLLDPDRLLYVKRERLARRSDHRLVGGAWVIRVNQQLIPPAARFALMAEGFYILHETGQLALVSRGEAAMDWLARKWAAMLLMPERWVRHVWAGCDHHVARTAQVMGVSTAAMRIRLRELGLLGCGNG